MSICKLMCFILYLWVCILACIHMHTHTYAHVMVEVNNPVIVNNKQSDVRELYIITSY
jgi:hypothetical protein